jgi:hypothetical protein
LEVGSQIGAGGNVDESVDTAQGLSQIRGVQINHPPVHPVGSPTLGTDPDHGPDGSPGSRTRQQSTHDAVTDR